MENQKTPPMYCAEDIAQALGIKASSIINYTERGYLLGTGGLYSAGSLITILKKEIGKKENKGRIEQEGNTFIINKRSIDDLVEAARIIKPRTININKPVSDRGQSYHGTLKAYIPVLENLEIVYKDQDYTTDTREEAQQIVEAFAQKIQDKLHAARKKDESFNTSPNIL
jgi:hypothetical protein